MPVMPMPGMPAWNTAGPEVMEIEGRFDADNAVRIEEDLLLCIESGAREMLIDCNAMTAITAAGVHSLLRVARVMQNVGGKLAVCNLHKQPREMFEACGIEHAVAAYADDVIAKIALAA